MSPSPCPRRTAFTLIELLVVLAILAVLVGLLLAAVQKARETANRLRCLSNLRQLALATHSYHDEHGRFPQGQFLGPYGKGPDSYAWSWLAQELPYLEQGNVVQQGQIPYRTLRQSDVAAVSIKLFLCPSDGSSGPQPRTNAGNLTGFAVGQSNYKGVSGANWGSDTSENRVTIDTDWPNRGANGSYDGLDNGDGAMFRSDWARGNRLASITDGTSNTFLIGEDVAALNEWSSWPYANNAYGTCAIPPNVKRPQGGSYPPGDWQNTWSFRSRHPGGLNFAYADGSAHFVSDSISLPLYRALATISGGEPVEAP